MRQALRRDALEQAALLLRRRALARRRPDPAAAPGRAADGPQRRAGAPSTRSTSCRCPTRGSTRGSPRGTSAFHCVALAHVDPAFAKYQLIAALPRVVPAPERRAAGVRVVVRRRQPARCRRGRRSRCSRSTAARDLDFLQPRLRQAARQLHLVGEPPGRGRLERLRGRLPRARQHRPDRPLAPARRGTCSSSPTRPAGWRSTRSAWLRSPSILDRHGSPATTTSSLKFLEHFALISEAMRGQGSLGRRGRLLLRPARAPRRHRRARCRVRSMVGVLPLLAFAVVDETGRAPGADGRQALRRGWSSGATSRRTPRPRCVDAASPASDGSCSASSRSTHLLRDPRAAVRRGARSSRPTGCGAVSRWHREHPYHLDDRRHATPSIDYEPAESTTGMFGGNSNWRGPVWFPVNYLVVDALAALRARTSATTLTLEYPTGSGQQRDARRDRARTSAAG